MMTFGVTFEKNYNKMVGQRSQLSIYLAVFSK